MRLRYAVAALLLLAGCSSDPGPDAEPTPAPTASDSPTGSGGAGETPPEQPAQPALDWRPAPGPVDRPLTTNASGTELTGGAHREAFLTTTHSLVVEQDAQETEPARAVLTDLASGEETVIDGRSDVPTTTGGTWALGPDTLVHATVAEDGAYCLATVDLATGAGETTWCAPDRTGFTEARITAAGTTLQTFDDGRPSCRTVVIVADGTTTPIDGPPECTAWDAVLLDSGPVWTVVRNERNVEAVDVFAQGPDGPTELGPGTAGTLTECGGAAYVVRDPQRDTDPARLVRWDGTRAEVVYESPAGPAFLDAPRCGGDALTVTAYAEGGDEQVTATLG